jgi:hypothetical protein
VRPPSGEEEQWTLGEGGQPGNEQCRREDEQQRDREVPEEILRQAEGVEQRRTDHREDAEAADEPEDDPVRPAAGGAAGEQDRQDRQHARRQSGDHARQERDAEEDHRLIVGRRTLLRD